MKNISMKRLKYKFCKEVSSQTFDKVWVEVSDSVLERVKVEVDLSIWVKLWVLQTKIRMPDFQGSLNGEIFE